ncbi:hypothetical protein BD408DRAFT_418646 [Parasitella parasitica]|nr:hypothetical protein BD408DRAFT_418646 [Parasitella parasitica]
MEINFISIYDNSAKAKYLFVSESVTDVLGYLPEELVGESGYNVTHPDERQALGMIHSANVQTERMSSVISYRARHKNGHYVSCDVVIHYCYNVFICTNFALVSSDCVKHNMRANTADEVFVIQLDGSIQLAGVWNGSQKRMKKTLTKKYPWDVNNNVLTKHEPRFSIFINRYTKESLIVFATQMCESMVGMNQEHCIGQSLYEYIAPQDKENVFKSIEMSKSTDIINRLRFNWLRQDTQELIPLEAVVSCTNDGLVFVARARYPTI